jgi:hypothetical protein
MPPFFSVKFASVYDTDGVQLGEGEQIIVNSAAVQMQSATRRRIETSAQASPVRIVEQSPQNEEPSERATRAA